MVKHSSEQVKKTNAGLGILVQERGNEEKSNLMSVKQGRLTAPAFNSLTC